MKKRLLILLSMLMLLTGCGVEEGGGDYVELNTRDLATITPTSGGVITVPIKNIETMNPLHTSNNYYYQFSKLIFDDLFQYDEEGNVLPNLVEYYNLSPDGLILSLTIKDGIKWHDGVDFSTEDIKMSFDAIKRLDEDNIYYKFLKSCVGDAYEFDINSFAKARVFDNRNIDFIFDKPYANYLDMMVFPIFPSHLYKSSNLPDDSSFKPIGTGPYMLAEVEPNQYIKLEKNESYHSKAPYVDTVYGKFVDDAEQATIAFETGQLNLAKDNKSYDWSKYENNTRIKFEDFQTNELEVVAINTSRSRFQGSVGKAVRTAITQGINKDRIINSVYLGKGIETPFLTKANEKRIDVVSGRHYYSKAEAKKTLSEVGFVDMDNDGFFEDELGSKINVGVKANGSNANSQLTAEFIVEDLRECGINAYLDFETISSSNKSKEVQTKAFNTFISDIKTGNYDIALFSINLSEVTDLTSMLHTDSIGSGFNIARYSDPEVDELLAKTKVSVEGEPIELAYEEIKSIFYRDMPYVPLFFKKDALLIDVKLQNKINPVNSNWYRGFRNIFILKHDQ